MANTARGNAVAERRRLLQGALLAGCLALLGAPVAHAQPADPQERAALRTFLENTIADADSFEDKYDAEVWLVDMSQRLSRFIKDPEHRLDRSARQHRKG